MENETKNTAAGGAGSAAAVKPKLTATEQIAHLKTKGVAFNLCSEAEAARWLTEDAYYFKIASYRGLFERRIGGALDGQYVNLDFAYLTDLYEIDRKLRYTLLPLTLDIEHYARTKINRIISERTDEDGYALVKDYLNSLTSENRKRRENDVARLTHDPFCNSLANKYKNNMPEWVAMELWTFGSFVDFYRFCAKRWNDKTMMQEHYILRRVKTARNAYAHSTCILNALHVSEKNIKTQTEVIEALTKAGVSKSARKNKMKKMVLHQIATIVYAYSYFVNNQAFRSAAANELAQLKERIGRHKEYYEHNDMLRSSFEFIEKALDIL